MLGRGEVQRSMTDRLMSLLAEQLDFLSVSCKRCDAGHLHEAKQIAHRLRVLLHDTGSSVSLLHQLGWKHELKLLDTRWIRLLTREVSQSLPWEFHSGW